jgi:FKBP-type peptidyl-prolyl cis-trans isomerase
MKKVLLLVLALCLVAGTGFAADDKAKKEAAKPAAKPAAKTSAKGEFKTTKEKASYVLGHTLGMRISQDKDELDIKIFNQGLQEGLAGKKSKISAEEAQKAMAEFQAQAQAKARMAAAKAAMKNKTDGDKYMAEFAKKKGVKKTKSGLMYRVLKPGKGAAPKATDTVTTHYTGTLVDGTVFDSSIKRGEPATFPVNGVIKGWQEALAMMKPGAKWEIVLPPSLAYGPRGAGRVIGPNATLVFQLELLKIEPPKPEPKKDAKPEAKPADKAKEKAAEKPAKK